MPTTPLPALPPHLDGVTRARVIELAERPYAVASRSQLLDVGITDSQVDRSLAVARWRDAGANVVVVHNGPLTTVQQWGVAVIAGGQVCGLAARAAARAAVHESRRFSEGDLLTGVWPRRVRIERALIDGAAWSRSSRTACGFLAAGVQQRLTTASRLLDELDQAGAIRHRRVLAAALTDIAGGAHAVSELDFIKFCCRHGLIDGALHLVVRTYWDDMSRGNELSIARETALRFPSIVIHNDDPSAIDQLRRALGLSGPPAQGRACGRARAS